MRVEGVSCHLRREPNSIIPSGADHVIFTLCLVLITVLRQEAQGHSVLFHLCHAFLILNSVSGPNFVSVSSS